MARVKGGVTSNRRRRNILAQVKGYRFDRSKKKRAAREAIYHAQLHAFDHRKDKKGDFRRLWTTRINAAARTHGMTYGAFIKALKDKDVRIDRKILASLARDNPDSFRRVIEHVK